MMPLTLEENVTSRRTETDDYDNLERVTRLYLLKGTDDDAAAKQFVMDETPTSYLTLPRGPIELDPDWVDTDSGTGKWDVTVTYQHPPRVSQTPGAQPVFAFDTGGGTKHITQSILTVDFSPPAAPGPPAADHKEAIGCDGERLQGTDIVTSVYQFTETHFKDDGFVTTGYKQTLALLTGTVNDASFKGFDPGEVLFLGASGSKRGDDKWELTYRFAASKNQTGLVIGGLASVDKKGWQYLWVEYESVEDATAHRLPKQPVAVYVEQVYESGDFSDLDIGV